MLIKRSANQKGFTLIELLVACHPKPCSPNVALAKLGRRKTTPGFTLIELLVVIAIIGILATFIVASFSSAQQRGRDSKRKSDLDALKKALELAKSDSAGSSYYPQTISSASIVTPGYIKAIPADPSTAGAYIYTGAPGGCTTQCTGFTLTACLENANDPQKDAVDTCGAAGAPVSYTVSNP